jgi:hypothetical protein
MTGRQPSALGLAQDAAEAIRALAHATRPARGGLTYPGDAYELLGVLGLLAGCLPQVLAQIEAFLTGELAAGRVVIAAGDHTGNPGAVIGEAAAFLRRAQAAAAGLARDLDAAQSTLVWAGAPDPTPGPAPD